MNFKNKKVTVVGLGKSGFAVAKFLWAQKSLVRVTEGSEKKEALENASYLRTLGLEVETGAHTEKFVSGSDYVVTSPGCPNTACRFNGLLKKIFLSSAKWSWPPIFAVGASWR